MAIKGELNGLKLEITCIDCKETLPLDVHQSEAGYYIGFLCPNCGPYSRETRYYRTYDFASKALGKVKEGQEIEEKRGTEYHPEKLTIEEV